MGLKKNFAYSVILTTANYLFPLIVFPYVSRRLGVFNIGIYNYTDNVILYFTMLSMMGMGVLGIREIASAHNNEKRLNQIFTNLFCLNLAFTVLSIATLVFCINYIAEFNQYKELLYIGCFNIISNFLLLDWLYKGLEKFPYITKRTLIVKCIYVTAVFIFINNPNDYILYYILTTLSVAINAAINLWHSRNYIKIDFSDFSMKQYLKPFIRIGVYWILTTLYASFYTIYLGFVSTAEHIGFFTTASKFIILTMSVYTAWTNVVMPRSSALLSIGLTSAFKDIIDKSVNVLFAFSIPIIIIGCSFSQEIVLVLAGSGYEGAAIPTTILMPLIFIIGYSQILIIQILMPMKKDKILLKNSLIGAFVGITLGFILVPRYLAIGASISWLTSEFVVLTLSAIYVQKHLQINIRLRSLVKNILCHTPSIIICYLLSEYLPFNCIVRLLIGTSAVIIYTIFIQFIYLKEPLFIHILDAIKRDSKPQRKKSIYEQY